MKLYGTHKWRSVWRIQRVTCDCLTPRQLKTQSMSTLPSTGNCQRQVSCTINCNIIYARGVNVTALSLVTNLRLIAHKYTSIYILKAQDTVSLTAFTFVQSSLCCQHLWMISYILDTFLHVSLILGSGVFSRLRPWDREKIMVAQLRKNFSSIFKTHAHYHVCMILLSAPILRQPTSVYTLKNISKAPTSTSSKDLYPIIPSGILQV